MSPNKIFYTFSLIGGMLLLFLSGCYYDTAEELYPNDAAGCDTTNTTFTAIIQPIIQDQCLSCHSAAANQGNVNLEGYAQMKTYADNGKLLGSVSYASGYIAMPQGAPQLSGCSINKIKAWINSGSPNN